MALALKFEFDFEGLFDGVKPLGSDSLYCPPILTPPFGQPQCGSRRKSGVYIIRT